MSSVSLESGLGTISFDGQILELFGFGEADSRRFHVGQIQGWNLGQGPVGSLFVVDLGPSGSLKMSMRLSDADVAAIESLMAEVMAAKDGGA
jgi:hypothetical protein